MVLPLIMILLLLKALLFMKLFKKISCFLESKSWENKKSKFNFLFLFKKVSVILLNEILESLLTVFTEYLSSECEISEFKAIV